MAEIYSSILIPFETRSIGDASRPTVNGRDIHAFLDIAKDYNAWMRQQIKRAHLLERRDFTTYQEVGNPRQYTRPKRREAKTSPCKHRILRKGIVKITIPSHGGGLYA